MQDIIGARQAIWVEAMFSPRYLVVLERRNDTWWYILWYRDNNWWKYGVFEVAQDSSAVHMYHRVLELFTVLGT